MEPRSEAGTAFRPFVVLFAPIAIVASLIAVRAVAETLTIDNPAMPPLTPAIIDAGVAPEVAIVEVADAGVDFSSEDAKADDASDDEVAEFDGKLPNFGALAPYPDAQDIVSRAQLGADGAYWSEVDGKRVRLTLDPHLQHSVEALLRTYAPPFAAVAAIDPHSGRVLAMAQESHEDPKVHALGLRAVYPAASVFKIVTAAALLEKGVDPNQTTCFHGGKHRIQPKLLLDNPGDRACLDMGDAMAKSVNVVFAKLASKNLTPDSLRSTAGRFGFNRQLFFDQPMDKSPANIPETPFEFATTAAGFGQVFLSPLHGALLASTVGNKGVMPRPFVIEGTVPAAGQKVIDPKIAAQLAEMMERTISGGTARRAFHDRGRPAIHGINVAGKTGSLDDQKPFRDYTWFVGFAPVENPEIAVAAVIVNGPLWRVRAPYIARETFRAFLGDKPGVAPKRVQGRR